jgi:hypothetical protein
MGRSWLMASASSSSSSSRSRSLGGRLLRASANRWVLLRARRSSRRELADDAFADTEDWVKCKVARAVLVGLKATIEQLSKAR